MASSCARRRHVRVQAIRRKSFKRRSKRAKHRKHTKKSIHGARSLITFSLLEQNACVTHVSVVRIPAITTEKIVKKKNKQSRKVPQADITDQQQIYDRETQHNDIQSFIHSQRKTSKGNIQVFNIAERIHYTDLNNHNDQHRNILELSTDQNKSINSTVDKIVLPTFQILSSNPTHRIVSLSLHQSNRKDVNLSHNTIAVLSPSLINKGFSAITRSNKKSTVYPKNEQQHQFPLSKKKKRRFSLCNIILACILLGLLLAGIIIAIVLPLTMSKDKATISTITTVPTTTTAPVCTTGSYMACSTLMYHNLNVGYSPPSAWTPVSCCYITPTANQITIEIAVQEDDSGYWMLDDVSATQGNGELVANRGFESSLTNWTLIVYSNATSATTVDSLSGGQHTGVAYLYGASANAPTYIRQTFSVIQGQNVLISFWWKYFPAFGTAFGTSELSVTLTSDLFQFSSLR